MKIAESAEKHTCVSVQFLHVSLDIKEYNPILRSVKMWLVPACVEEYMLYISNKGAKSSDRGLISIDRKTSLLSYLQYPIH